MSGAGSSGPAPRRKKRVRPPRKIVPRGRMSPAWVIASLVIAGVLAVAGAIFLLTQTP